MAIIFYNAEYYQTTYNDQPVRAVYIPELQIKLIDLGLAFKRSESELYVRTREGKFVHRQINSMQVSVPADLVTGAVRHHLIQAFFLQLKTNYSEI